MGISRRISRPRPSAAVAGRASLAALLMLCTLVLGLAAGPGPARAASPETRARLAAAGDPACPAATGPDYSNQDLTNHNFASAPPGSLKGANFNGATLKGAIFSNQDLTGATFQGADLGPSTKGSVDFTGTTLTNACFIGAVMNATDFTFANFNCTDFSATSLMQAQFGPAQNIAHNTSCRTRFVGSTIDVHAITTNHWGFVDFTNAQFQNLGPSTFSLAGKDITGAMLGGTNFDNIDFHGANLTQVDFSKTSLSRANLAGTALNGATLVNAQLPYATLDCAQFYASSAQAPSCGTPVGPACAAVPVSTAPTAAADLTQVNLQGASLLNTVFDSAAFPGANLSGVTAIQATFRNASLEASGVLNVAGVQGANLTQANFQNAHVNFVQFNNTTLTGACFDQRTTLNGTVFSGSIMPGATFDSAVLEGVSFNATILESAVFTNATMKTTPGGGSAVNFSCAQLGGSNFLNANVMAANFQAAVMPPASACCPQKSGAWCGTVDITQLAYGGVNYPTLQNPVTCPNGDVANCSATQWTIPNWQTNLCSVNHTTQTVWSKPDCGGTPGDQVKFNDPNLKACILATLPGKPSSISVTTAATLLEIACPGLGISDLTGLQAFTGLVSLDLSGNQIAQFKQPLPQLNKLNLASNQLTALDITAQAANLINLDVSHNQLQSIVGLANLNPVVLDLSYNQFASFDLAVFDSLVFADLSHNQLTNVLDSFNKNLSRMTSLGYLDLSYNSIPTIGDASAIAATGPLASLFLECNPTFDCPSLNLTGTSTALQKSQCALFNSQSGQWIVQPHPVCPTQQGTRQAQAR
jgi:uncharacterized protein YjbI with pentapeptide repeats